mmetsp:Transcript_80746/g.211980  ORF Transcript_80746/g.211980 Transcript_80746/m.211980 type:complete len:611 (-) Transcript_80746:73-1905(-)
MEMTPEHFDIGLDSPRPESPQASHAEWLKWLCNRLAQEGLDLADLPHPDADEFGALLAELGFGSALDRARARKAVRNFQLEQQLREHEATGVKGEAAASSPLGPAASPPSAVSSTDGSALSSCALTDGYAPSSRPRHLIDPAVLHYQQISYKNVDTYLNVAAESGGTQADFGGPREPSGDRDREGRRLSSAVGPIVDVEVLHTHSCFRLQDVVGREAEAQAARAAAQAEAEAAIAGERAWALEQSLVEEERRYAAAATAVAVASKGDLARAAAIAATAVAASRTAASGRIEQIELEEETTAGSSRIGSYSANTEGSETPPACPSAPPPSMPQAPQPMPQSSAGPTPTPPCPPQPRILGVQPQRQSSQAGPAIIRRVPKEGLQAPRATSPLRSASALRRCEVRVLASAPRAADAPQSHPQAPTRSYNPAGVTIEGRDAGRRQVAPAGQSSVRSPSGPPPAVASMVSHRYVSPGPHRYIAMQQSPSRSGSVTRQLSRTASACTLVISPSKPIVSGPPPSSSSAQFTRHAGTMSLQCLHPATASDGVATPHRPHATASIVAPATSGMTTPRFVWSPATPAFAFAAADPTKGEEDAETSFETSFERDGKNLVSI